MGRQQRLRLASRYPIFLLVLILCALMPTGAPAQETATPISPPRPASPDGFQTVTTAISTPSPTAVSLLPSSISARPSSSPTNTSQLGDGNDGFNYYFIIIAGAAVVFVIFFILMARRRRIQAVLRHTNEQRALSEDIGGFRSPRYGRGWGPDVTDTSANTRRHGMRRTGRQGREEVPEGLNERGEAPPPYVPGSKPPSLRTDDGRMSRESNREMVEMGHMRPVYRSVPKGEPPVYHREQTGSSSHHENVGREEATGAARPETAEGSVTRPDTVMTRP